MLFKIKNLKEKKIFFIKKEKINNKRKYYFSCKIKFRRKIELILIELIIIKNSNKIKEIEINLRSETVEKLHEYFLETFKNELKL